MKGAITIKKKYNKNLRMFMMLNADLDESSQLYSKC